MSPRQPTKAVHFRLPVPHHEWIERQAEMRGAAIAQVVRDIVIDHVGPQLGAQPPLPLGKPAKGKG